jgi:hypothetical protein
MPTPEQLQAVRVHQNRILEIDKAIKGSENFIDQKAFLQNEKGDKVLMNRQELYTLRAVEEAAIKKLI